MTSGLSRRAAALLIGVNPSTLHAWSDAGVGPRASHRRYDINEVHKRLDEVGIARAQLAETCRSLQQLERVDGKEYETDG